MLAVSKLDIHAEETTERAAQQSFEDRLTDLQTSPVSDLSASLSDPLSGDQELGNYIEAPEHMLTMGWIRDFIDDYIYRSMMPSETASPLPLPLATEYARRLQIAAVVYEKDPKAVAQWFWNRRDIRAPTILDALVFAASATPSSQAQDPFDKGRDLFNAQNPIVRMFAARHVAQVIGENERAEFLERSLNDDYWYARKTALVHLRAMHAETREPILRRHLEATRDEVVNEEFAARKASFRRAVEGLLTEPEAE